MFIDKPMLSDFKTTESVLPPANGGAIPRRLQYRMDEQDVAPGEAFDLRFTARRRGLWLFHCHNLTHVTGPNGADAGMITVVKVT